MKRIYKVRFEAQYRYKSNLSKRPSIYWENDSISVLAGRDASQAIDAAKSKSLGKQTRGVFRNSHGKTERFVCQCVDFMLTSVSVEAQTE